MKRLVSTLCLILLATACVDPEQFEVTDAEIDAAVAPRDRGVQPPADRGPAPDAAPPADAAPMADAGTDDAGPATDAGTDDAGPELDQGPEVDMAEPPSACQVTFEAALPEGTPQEQIYLAGTFFEAQGRAWNPGDAELAMLRDGAAARVTLTLEVGARFEYKFARGDWDRVEVNADCSEAQNRVVRVGCGDDGTFGAVDVVAAWKDTCP